MAQSRKKRASTPSRKRGKPAIKDDPAPIVADAGTIRQALDELGIDRPVMQTRVVGRRLELTLYGGDVVTWPAEAGAEPPTPAPQQKQGRSRRTRS